MSIHPLFQNILNQHFPVLEGEEETEDLSAEANLTLTDEDIDEIIDQHLCQGRVVERLRI